MARIHSILILAVFGLAACGGARVSVGAQADASTAATKADGSTAEEAALEVQPPEADGEDASGASAAAGRGRRVEAHTGPMGVPTLTLPGFRTFRDGRSRVFVEIRGRASVKQRKSSRRLVYIFSGVRVPERVNRLALPTRHFPTPVRRVRLTQLDSTRAQLVIELRAETQAKSRLRRKEGGTVLSIDFPPYIPATGQGTRGVFVEEKKPRRRRREKARPNASPKPAAGATKAPPKAPADKKPAPTQSTPEAKSETKKAEADAPSKDETKAEKPAEDKGAATEGKVEQKGDGTSDGGEPSGEQGGSGDGTAEDKVQGADG